MILDFIVLNNGLPIFTINFDPMRGLSHDEKKFTLISGFFSAISSFVDSLDNLGNVDEIQMSSDTFFSFQRKQINEDEVLFILISSSETPKNIRKEIISDATSKFLNLFKDKLEEPWNGQTAVFNDFNDVFIKILKTYIKSMPDQSSNNVENQTNDSNEENYIRETYEICQLESVSYGFNASDVISTEIDQDFGDIPPNNITDRYERHQMMKFMQNSDSYQTNNANNSQMLNARMLNAFSGNNRVESYHNNSLALNSQFSRNSNEIVSNNSYQPELSPEFGVQHNLFHENDFSDYNENNVKSQSSIYTQFMKPHPSMEAMYTNRQFNPTGLVFHDNVYDIIPKKGAISVETYRSQLTDKWVRILFVSIDGQKSIGQLAQQLDSDPQEILLVCEELKKRNLIQFQH